MMYRSATLHVEHLMLMDPTKRIYNFYLSENLDIVESKNEKGLSSKKRMKRGC